MSTYDLSASQVIAGTPEQAYDAVVLAPLERLFGRRSGPIPPVKRTEDFSGVWGSVGQTRTIVLGAGGRLHETVRFADRPADFGYLLSDVRGPMKPLARSVEGRFTFVAEGAGTRVTWSWRMHLTSPAVRLLMPVFGTFWRRGAAGAFAEADQSVRESGAA